MPPRIVRGQLALDIGDRLKDLGQRLLRLDQYSGEALENQLSTISTGISVQLLHIETLLRSCRAAKNSYPNAPATRKALAEAGDEVYDIQEELHVIQTFIHSHNNKSEDWVTLGNRLLSLATRLKLVQFVPPEKVTSP